MLDALVVLFLYLLMGAFYGTWRLYYSWQRVIVPVAASGLSPRAVRIVVGLLIVLMTALWPWKLYVHLQREWQGRHVPKHIRKIAERAIAQHLTAMGIKTRERLDSIYGPSDPPRGL